MDKKLYIIAFDPAIVDANRLHNAISKHPKIFDWMHYIRNAYIVASYSSAQEIFDDIHSALDNQSFIIIEVVRQYGNRQGWLPKDAWDWLKKHDT